MTTDSEPVEDSTPTQREQIREHYRRVQPVYETLATIETTDGATYPTTWVVGNAGWYTYSTTENGVHRRGNTVRKDYDAMVERFDEDNRTMYVITSWKDAAAVFEGKTRPSRDDFETGDGLGEYGDVRGVTVWGDVDLNDKDSRDELTDEERMAIERDLETLVDEIAALLELTPEHTALFDSGGGAYPFGPAAVTLPIAERFEEDDHARIMEELIGRINDHLETSWTPESNLLTLDAGLNNNRQTKAPLSIHASKDVLVAPLRDEDGSVTYTPTPVDALDDELIERTVEECQRIVADTDEIRAAVGPLVTTVFDEFEGDWDERLTAWNDAERQRIIERDHIKGRIEKKRRDRRRAQVGDSSIDLSDYDGATVTDDIAEVYAAIDAIPIAEVVKEFACDEWDTGDRSGETNFNPSWRTSESGKSCFITKGSNIFGDNSADAGGGPITAYALGEGYISDASDHPSGREFFECVAGLRRAGYDIPIWVPPVGATKNNRDDEYEQTPLIALRKAAVALTVCTPKDFVERETDDGNTYTGFPSVEIYNATLSALEEKNIEHGRERLGDGEETVSARVKLGLADETDDELTDEERYAKDVLIDLLG